MLEVKNLSLSFGTSKILDEISFKVSKGEFVCFLGPSGCGKSSILNCLTNVLPYSGEIISRGKFSYMPQEDLLFPWLKVIDNVTLASKIKGIDKRQEALEKLEKFGLKGYENMYPDSLSGGMRQRASFLRTSLCDLEIMLLDEPFGALDVITRGEMQDWLLNIRSELNKTIVMVTHDIEEALYLADKIYILSNKPTKIKEIIDLSNENKSRDWLYKSSKLRKHIYEVLKSENIF